MAPKRKPSEAWKYKPPKAALKKLPKTDRKLVLSARRAAKKVPKHMLYIWGSRSELAAINRVMKNADIKFPTKMSIGKARKILNDAAKLNAAPKIFKRLLLAVERINQAEKRNQAEKYKHQDEHSDHQALTLKRAVDDVDTMISFGDVTVAKAAKIDGVQIVAAFDIWRRNTGSFQWTSGRTRSPLPILRLTAPLREYRKLLRKHGFDYR